MKFPIENWPRVTSFSNGTSELKCATTEKANIKVEIRSRLKIKKRKNSQKFRSLFFRVLWVAVCDQLKCFSREKQKGTNSGMESAKLPIKANSWIHFFPFISRAKTTHSTERKKYRMNEFVNPSRSERSTSRNGRASGGERATTSSSPRLSFHSFRVQFHRKWQIKRIECKLHTEATIPSKMESSQWAATPAHRTWALPEKMASRHIDNWHGTWTDATIH